MRFRSLGMTACVVVEYIGLCLSATAIVNGPPIGPASSPPPKQYVVYSGNTTKQTRKIRDDLRILLGTENVLEIGGPYSGPQCWLVDMHAQQIKNLAASNPGVSYNYFSKTSSKNQHDFECLSQW